MKRSQVCVDTAWILDIEEIRASSVSRSVWATSHVDPEAVQGPAIMRAPSSDDLLKRLEEASHPQIDIRGVRSTPT